jgi:NADH:ubiquinone oxidoreductase subunit 6 (subunit J)
VTAILIVLIAGAIAHAIVSHLTRTPEEDQTPRRWKYWHTAVAGIISGIALAAVALLVWVATGAFPPVWTLLAASDVLAIGWKVHHHRKRSHERRELKALFERPSFGEGSQ